MDKERIMAMRALYARVPKIQCKRLCGHACRTSIDMSDVERERIETALARPLPLWMSERPGLMCPLLSPQGECGVYGLRPLICRLWGVVDTEALRCNHGCEVEGGMLTTVEANRLMMEALRIGGSRFDPETIEQIDAVFDRTELAPLLDRYISGDRSPELIAEIQELIRDTVTE